MANLRVFEFSKKHDVPTKKVIEKAKELGIDLIIVVICLRWKTNKLRC